MVKPATCSQSLELPMTSPGSRRAFLQRKSSLHSCRSGGAAVCVLGGQEALQLALSCSGSPWRKFLEEKGEVGVGGSPEMLVVGEGSWCRPRASAEGLEQASLHWPAACQLGRGGWLVLAGCMWWGGPRSCGRQTWRAWNCPPPLGAAAGGGKPDDKVQLAVWSLGKKISALGFFVLFLKTTCLSWGY